jgi:hypothetical protein
MTPAAAVSGFYLAHPQARYFASARSRRDQLEDWASAPASASPKPNAGWHRCSRQRAGRDAAMRAQGLPDFVAA